MSDEHKNICTVCDKECNIGDCGNAIAVDFPYGHPLDSLDEYKLFCSDECLIAYLTKKGVN